MYCVTVTELDSMRMLRKIVASFHTEVVPVVYYCQGYLSVDGYKGLIVIPPDFSVDIKEVV